MFQRFHEMREDREDGFTLIELLVVVLIIAILAAIAIPFFLAQRERSFESQAQSALKNAATAMESYGTQNEGSYVGAVVGTPGTPSNDPKSLETQGFNHTQKVVVSIVSATASDYCLKANHDNLGTDWYYDSETGDPSTTVCT